MICLYCCPPSVVRSDNLIRTACICCEFTPLRTHCVPWNWPWSVDNYLQDDFSHWWLRLNLCNYLELQDLPFSKTGTGIASSCSPATSLCSCASRVWFWLLCWCLPRQPSAARPLRCLGLQPSHISLRHCSSRFSSSAKISGTNMTNSTATGTLQATALSLFCAFLTNTHDQYYWTKAQLITSVCMANTSIFMLIFWGLISSKMVPKSNYHLRRTSRYSFWKQSHVHQHSLPAVKASVTAGSAVKHPGQPCHQVCSMDLHGLAWRPVLVKARFY